MGMVEYLQHFYIFVFAVCSIEIREKMRENQPELKFGEVIPPFPGPHVLSLIHI